jgi:glyoxylase-like metal-dependent hydrolase (beta-lactamase superfamily II)
VFSDGYLTLPVEFLAPEAPPAELKAALQAVGLPTDAVQSPVNVTLVKSGDNLILIDAGSGTTFMDSAGKLQDNLEAAGISREAVTHVVFTHAHPDHLWGAIDDFDGTERFPNASYHMSAAEFDFWSDKDVLGKLEESRHGFAVGAQRVFKTIGDKIRRVKPGDAILPGMAVVETYGHTPGHVSIELVAGSERALILGDAITSAAVSFLHPDWKTASDQVPDQAIVTRKRLLDKLATEKTRIVGYHLPGSGIGFVERKGTAYRFVAG